MNRLLLFIKGVLMWACDVIPWVSGGTIAFITGIYDELLDALHSINFKTFKLLFTFKFAKFWKAIHGNFLLTLFGWIIVAILSLVKLIHWLLMMYPEHVWAFFFGLILASAFILRKQIKKWKHYFWILLVIWIVVWFFLTSISVLAYGDSQWAVLWAWAIAIIAMILPGISGSYILLIIWQYKNILWTIVDVVDQVKLLLSWWDTNMALFYSSLGKLWLFIVGAVVWLILFAKLLHWIKAKWHDQMVVVLTGFMIGSLNKVWPWKKTVEVWIDRHGEKQPLVQQHILPSSLEQILWGVGLALVGSGVVILVYKLSHKLNK